MIDTSLSRSRLLCGAAVLSFFVAAPAFAETPAFAEAPAADDAAAADNSSVDGGEVIVTGVKATRSATAITELEIQKILSGVAPFKAIQTLPGVMYVSSDPWFNHRRLLEPIGNIPPAEAEDQYYAAASNLDMAA